MRKTILQERYSCSVQKTAQKKPPNIREMTYTILKIGHLAKAIALEKCSVWVKNLKCQKHTKNYSTRTLQLVSAKNRWKKNPIFEK